MADDSTACPKCGRDIVTDCDGEGRIYINDNTVRICPNFRAMKIKLHLGPELYAVQHVKVSPLFEMDKRGLPPKVNRTDENLRIHCSWRGLLPHLKLALGCLWDSLNYTIITDQQIKNVYVGNEQYKSRPKGQRENIPTFNSPADLVGIEHDLVIIKLGYIGHPNKAAAGALKETLQIREDMTRPVWLIEDDDRHPWTHSNDPDVEHYVESVFEDVYVEGADPGPRYRRPSADVGMEAHDEDEPEEEANQEEPYEDYEEDDDDDDGGGEGSLTLPSAGAKNKWKKRWN